VELFFRQIYSTKRDMSTASWAGLDTVTLTYIAPPSQQSSRTSEDYEDTLRVP
jgi:hypothetical protein